MLEVGNADLSDLEARSHLMLWAMLAASQDPLGRQGARTARHGAVDVWTGGELRAGGDHA